MVVASPGAMIDKDQKNAILAAEREFERRENLARALAVSGITLIGRITSPADPGPPADPSVQPVPTPPSAAPVPPRRLANGSGD